MEDWMVSLPFRDIYCAASEHKLDTYLVAAFVSVESSGQRFKTRFEPGYKYLLDPGKWARSLVISEETEEKHQMTSWGLMQVMGATARELGFDEDMPRLTNASVGLRYGCLYLKKCMVRYPNEKSAAIAAYNAGSARQRDDGEYINQSYVDKILERYNKLKL